MAVKKQPRPLLACALICDQILQDKDNVMSLIRILDVITVVKPRKKKGKKPPKPVVPLKALIAFKSGNAKGEYSLRLELTTPTGEKMKVAEATMTFLGDAHGMNVHATIPAPVDVEGLCWYDVLVNGETVTRMPLEIRHMNPPENRPSATAAKQGNAK